MPRPGNVEEHRIIDRDGVICRPCGNDLSSATWQTWSHGSIRVCGECATAIKARKLGLSGYPDDPHGVVCYGVIAGHDGQWTC